MTDDRPTDNERASRANVMAILTLMVLLVATSLVGYDFYLTHVEFDPQSQQDNIQVGVTSDSLARAVLAEWQGELSNLTLAAQDSALSLLGPTIADLNRSIETRIDATLRQNEAHAARARDLARQALSQGEIGLAQTYAFNAITHMPSSIANLEFLVTLASDYSDHTSTEYLQRVAAVADVLLYEAPPDDIQSILGMRDEVLLLLEKHASLERPEIASQVDAARDIQDLTNTDVRLLWSDNANLIQQRALLEDALSTFVAETPEQVAMERTALAFVDKLITLESHRAQFDIMSAQIAEAHDPGTPLDIRLYLAEDAIAGSSALLARLRAKWIPEVIRNEVRARNTSAAEARGLIRCAMSRDPYKKARDLLDEIVTEVGKAPSSPVSTKQGRYESILDNCAQLVMDLNEVAAGIQCDDLREDLEGRVGEVRQKIQLVQDGQLASYQRWAAAAIRRAHERIYRETKFSFRNEDAIEAIRKTELISIDLSLLSPDLGRWYSTTLSKAFAELGAQNSGEMEYEIAMAKKVGREEF